MLGKFYTSLRDGGVSRRMLAGECGHEDAKPPVLRPVAGETRYFVYTRWESEDAFRAWADSAAFTRGHAQAARDRGATVATGSALLGFEVVQQVEKRRG